MGIREIDSVAVAGRVACFRILFVWLFALLVSACDSDGDALHLSNLVTAADAGYTSISIVGDTEAEIVLEVGESRTLLLEAFTDDESSDDEATDDESAGTIVNTAIWSSSDNTIATVASDGTVTGGGTDGTASITANFGNLTTSTSVRVSSAALQEILITAPSDTMNACSAGLFVAEGIYQGEEALDPRPQIENLVWSVAGGDATIDQTGLLRVTAAADLTVTATRAADGSQPEVVQSASVSVQNNLASITIVPDAGQLAVDSPLQYRAIPVYNDLPDEIGEITDNVSWGLSDSASSGPFASLDETTMGLVVPSRAGDGTLRAECVGTGISDTITVTAAGSGRISGLKITPVNPERVFPLNVPFTGAEIEERLVATALYADQIGGLNVTDDSEWTIDSGSDGTFFIGNEEGEDKGVLTITGPGTVNVTATFIDTDNNDFPHSTTVTITVVQ